MDIDTTQFSLLRPGSMPPLNRKRLAIAVRLLKVSAQAEPHALILKTKMGLPVDVLLMPTFTLSMVSALPMLTRVSNTFTICLGLVVVDDANTNAMNGVGCADANSLATFQ